jgi:hypothetical protein
MSATVYPVNGSEGFCAIEVELQKRREQSASIAGKDTPYRVEFRFRGGSRSYQYFETREACVGATATKCRYSPWGNAVIEYPSSKEIQIRGPRGGWRKAS